MTKAVFGSCAAGLSSFKVRHGLHRFVFLFLFFSFLFFSFSLFLFFSFSLFLFFSFSLFLFFSFSLSLFLSFSLSLFLFLFALPFSIAFFVDYLSYLFIISNYLQREEALKKRTAGRVSGTRFRHQMEFSKEADKKKNAEEIEV